MAEIKNFTKYVAEVKKEYKYTLKFAILDMADITIDKLQACLEKYQIISASAFKKTPIQENPLDFPNITNCPVWITDIVIAYPASIEFLRNYICNSIGRSEQEVVVYTENDPRQLETILYLERSSKEFKDNYKTRIGSMYEEIPGEDEHQDLYGKTYNSNFLKELDKVSKERSGVEYKDGEKQKIDHSNLPAGYNDIPTEDTVTLFGRLKNKIKN